MNNPIKSNPTLGSAFDAIFGAPAQSTSPSSSPTRAYRPSNISPHAGGDTKICMDCCSPVPTSQAAIVHPVPGLTMYRCSDCEAENVVKSMTPAAGAHAAAEAGALADCD